MSTTKAFHRELRDVSWKRPSWLVALTCLCVGACGNAGSVTGTVNEIEAGPLPGVHVTIDGLKTHREVTTDSDGRFAFQNLARGGYTLKADLAEYVGDTKIVTVSRGGTLNTEFVLHPACLEEGSYVDGGLRWGLQAAQAILYIRFVAVSDPDRWIVDGQCIVGIDHTATVLSILNMGPDSGSITKTVHLVRDGRVAWNTSEEYIAFVRWEPGIGRYRPIAGPLFMIPVRDGKVVWDRTDTPNIRNGDPVSKAMAALFALLPSARAAR
jgi:carboxypeptidase family protein